jgi:uncharacterized protein YciI
MRYVIIGHDVPNSLEQRLAARPAHLARLTAQNCHNQTGSTELGIIS